VSRRRNLAGAVCAAALCAAAMCAAALAGCGAGGASSSATKQDVIARGNAICTATLRAERATPSPSGTGASLATYFRSALPIVEKEAAQLRSLPRPARDRPVLTHYLAAMGAVAHEYRALAAAAAAGDAGATARALAALRSSPAPALAGRYGLTQCAAAAGTGASAG
jgi:hypothetical protein